MRAPHTWSVGALGLLAAAGALVARPSTATLRAPPTDIPPPPPTGSGGAELAEALTPPHTDIPPPPPTAPLPDLTISEMLLDTDPWLGCMGTTANLGTTVFVHNAGEGAAGAFTLEVLGRRHRIMTLGADRLRAVWLDRVAPPGDLTVAHVDPDDEVAETREDNNTRRERLAGPTLAPTCEPSPTATEVVGTPEPLPDLVPRITYRWTCPCWPCPEHEPHGTACTSNAGRAPARSWSKTVVDFGLFTESVTVPTIAPGGGACFDAASKSAAVLVDAWGQVRESAEDNNTAHFRAPTYTPPPPCTTPTATVTGGPLPSATPTEGATASATPTGGLTPTATPTDEPPPISPADGLFIPYCDGVQR